MIVHNFEDMIGVDVDETLISMVNPYSHTLEESNGVLLLDYDLSLEDPYGVLGLVYLKKHRPNINLVKKAKARGHHLFIWSRAGYKWAEVIAEALDITYCFEFCMTKPIQYIDDKDVSEWMTHRSFLEDSKVGWQND